MDKKNAVCSSAILGKDMHVNIYGKKGLPVIVFPTLAAAPESVEEVGIVDEIADYLDSGTIQLFCTETIDGESWASDADPAERAERQETFYHYVVDELVPLVHKVNKTDARPLALGFDMGATHAAIALLRRPDLFQGCVCLSGSYDARRYFGDWMDATLYDNTPCAFLPQMPADHPYVAIYNQRQLLFCCGQDASEADSLRTTRLIDGELRRLGVEAWCDYWGGDVTHTWPWWKKQLRYFLPIVLADVEKTTAAEKPVKKRATTRKKAATATKATASAAAPKAAAKKPAAAAKAAPKAEPAEKAAETKPATAKPAAAAKAAPKAEPAEKVAEAKPTTAKPAAAAKAAPKKAATAKPAATKEAAEKPVTIAKAEKPATPAKAEKPATPAKAVKAAVPAKAAKPATPAKATTAAAKKSATVKVAEATTTAPKKTAAKAAPKAAAKATSASKATTAKATKATTAKPAAAKPAASPKPAAKKPAKGGAK